MNDAYELMVCTISWLVWVLMAVYQPARNLFQTQPTHATNAPPSHMQNMPVMTELWDILNH